MSWPSGVRMLVIKPWAFRRNWIVAPLAAVMPLLLMKSCAPLGVTSPVMLPWASS